MRSRPRRSLLATATPKDTRSSGRPGRRGTRVSSGAAVAVTIFRDPVSGATPQPIIPTLPPVHAMKQQAINFILAIRGETSPPCETEEALEDLKVAREYVRLWKGK